MPDREWKGVPDHRSNVLKEYLPQDSVEMTLTRKAGNDEGNMGLSEEK